MKNLGSITDAKSLIHKEYADGTYASKESMTSLTKEVGDVKDAVQSVEKTKANVPVVVGTTLKFS